MLSIPVVAAIHGPAWAVGLSWRWPVKAAAFADDAKTVLGLPEVQLGLLPGSGGAAPAASGGRQYGAGDDFNRQMAARPSALKAVWKMRLPHAILLEAAERAPKVVRRNALPLAGARVVGKHTVRRVSSPLGRTLLFNMVGKTEQKPKGIIRQ